MPAWSTDRRISERYLVPSDSGQHPRHVDFMWLLRNGFDRTPEGRGGGWEPRLNNG